MAASEADRLLLAKGQVACRFEELTIDSLRNRFVRAALETVTRLVRQPALAHRCRGLAHGLRLQGVVGEAPSRQQITQERFSRHDAIAQVFPSMRTDIVIDHRDRPQRLVPPLPGKLTPLHPV